MYENLKRMLPNTIKRQYTTSIVPLAQFGLVNACSTTTRSFYSNVAVSPHRNAHGFCTEQFQFAGDTLPGEPLSRRMEQTEKIWSAMSQLELNIQHYNARLQIYLENEHQFAWTDVMDEIRSRGLQPDQQTYELIFEHLCRIGPMDAAMRFIGEIEAKGFKLTENIYGSMMLGYARVDDMAKAIAIPDEMRLRGVTQTVHTTATLMKCYAQRGEIDSIVDVFNSYVDENGRMENEYILPVIVELCLNGHENRIDPLLRRMERSMGYHQLVHCAILSLLRRGKIDGAYTLLKTMPRTTLPNGRLIDIGNFFLKNMTKMVHSTDTIMAMTRQITADGIHSRAIYIVLEHALQEGIFDVSIAALKELRQLREPIRLHYCWPILCSEGPKGKERLFEVIRMLQSEFQLEPDTQTVEEFILPHIGDSPSQQILAELGELGISMESIAPAMVLHRLKKFDIRGACEIAAAHGSIYYYLAKGLRKSLMTALLISKDYASFARLVRIIRDSLPLGQGPSDEDNEEWTMEEKQLDLVGSILFDAIFHLRNFNSVKLAMQSFIGEEIRISVKQGRRLKTFFSTKDYYKDVAQYIATLTAPHSKISTRKMQSSLEELSAQDMQYSIQFLLKIQRLTEAQKTAKLAAITRIRLSDETWQDLLYQLAVQGDIAALNEFKPFADNHSMVPLDILNDAYCTAFTRNGKGAEYLNHLEQQVNVAEKATDLEHFPRNSAITILSKNPELLDACKCLPRPTFSIHPTLPSIYWTLLSFADKSLVIKYLDKNCTIPLNALWMFYFVKGNDEECRDIWTNTLSMVPQLKFDSILQVARVNRDARLVDRLLKFLRTEEVDKANWIAVYDVLLDIHISNGAFDKAVLAIECAAWDDCYVHIDPRTILRIANELAAKGQTFPYQIPTKANKLSNSIDQIPNIQTK